MFLFRQIISLTFKQVKKFSLRRPRRKVTKCIFLLLFPSVLIFLFLLGRGNIRIMNWQKGGCPKYFLPEEQAWEYGSCLPHQASNESCDKVRTLYKLNPALTSCKASPSKRLCRLLLYGIPKHADDFRVECDNSICIEQNKSESIQVFNVNPSNGAITEARVFLTTADLQAALKDIIKENIKQKFHFVILRCTSKANDTKTRISQLVPIDPRLTIRTNASKLRDPNLLNVNILLLDSVSRAHFYRSLPKTIELFKQWRNNTPSVPAKVFDFELFQAVEGHTKENTHALFNGKLLYLNSSHSSQSVNPRFMFGAFQEAGYQTMWQEDLCWKGIWGLMLDLLAGGWGNLANRLQEHLIDHSGLTHAGCEILEYIYGINTPFSGPPGDQICYDGRFHHSYLLQYTLDTIRAITSTPTALPLLSYMSLSVGHDHIGRRIQSLDPALVQYVTQLSLNEDTLTVILSDHGNTYTSYTSTLEGRFEMFHPHLFLIVPNKVAQRLGDKALDALRINQHRLVNIIDLHHTIMALTKPLNGPVALTGLFTPISAQRTCQDFELRLPNLCVCEGWDNPTSNDDMKIILVEFALGYLNNQIETQVIKQTKNNSTLQLHRTRSCNRLRATLFKEVRERRVASRGTLITSMLIYVPPGSGSDEDVFNVVVESRDIQAQRSLDMKFLQYDRVSMYGHYRECADENVLLKLCICSKQSSNLNQQPLNITSLLAPPNAKYFGQETISTISQSECIYLVTRTHKSGVTFAYELANICKHGRFVVSVDVRSTGIKLTRPCPFNVTLLPDNIEFILAARNEKLHQKASIRIIAQIIKTVKY